MHTAEEQRERGTRIHGERDIGGIAMNQLRDETAEFVDVIEPAKEIGAGQFVAPREMRIHSIARACGHLSERGGVQPRPVPECRELSAYI
jgi:hypothetical protein